MNINDFIAPFDVLAADDWQTDAALHAAINLVLPNSFLFGIWGGFDVAPVATPVLLKILDGATVIWQVPITQDGPFGPFVFKPAPAATGGGALTVQLGDGGVGVTGYLNIASAPLSPAPPAFVQQFAGVEIASQLFELTLPDEPTPGNTLVACLAVDSSAQIVSVGAPGLAFTKAQSLTKGDVTTEIWYAQNIVGGADEQVIEVVLSTSNKTVVGNISEFSGLKTQAPDVAFNSGNSAVVSSNPVSPGSASSLMIAAGAWDDDDYVSGPTNAFTRLTQIGSGPVWLESAYLLATETGSYSSGWGLSTALDWAAMIVGFAGN
jgi:hypothetical protein